MDGQEENKAQIVEKATTKTSAINKSHVRFSPLQPPSCSWTQTE